nr:SpoIIE family protein phosphatase [Magnetospirillum sulfuroxidans]
MPEGAENIFGLVKLTPRPSWGKAAEVAAPAKSEAGNATSPGKTLRVLLVEDQPGDAMLVMIALRECVATRFQVTHVGTLADARRCLEQEAMDVVLLDLSLPDSSGLDTVTKVLDVAPRMPVVVMTGLDDPSLASRALEVGAQDYLVKSDDPGRAVERAILYAVTRMNSQIEREQLADQLAKEQQRVQEEMVVARTMQFDLLPRPDRLNPALERLGFSLHSYFEPCSGIGGDLWGCQDLGDGRISLIAFDFSGHGIGAALNVFRLHTLIDEHRGYLGDPAMLLNVLGLSLRQLLGRGQFATMFAAVIDCTAEEIIWSGAGTPPPVLFRGGRAEFLDTRGVPLGLSAKPSHENRRTTFPPGSSLLVYSDALVEAQGFDDKMLGSEGLLDIIGQCMDRQGHLAIEPMLDEFYSWARPPIEDDLTVIHLAWS